MRDVVARHFALLNGDVHDLVGSSAIANCVNMGHVSLHMGVGQNRFQCGIHPGFFQVQADRKSTRLNSSHSQISYAVFCLKKKKKNKTYEKRIKKHNTNKNIY